MHDVIGCTSMRVELDSTVTGPSPAGSSMVRAWFRGAV
jgi:hypothetical protein